jgi:hypothetical protein
MNLELIHANSLSVHKWRDLISLDEAESEVWPLLFRIIIPKIRKCLLIVVSR